MGKKGRERGKSPKKDIKEGVKLGDEYKERCLRLQAEFENYRKQLDKEKSEFTKCANESLIKDLLNVLDDFENSLQEVRKKDKELSHGMELIYKPKLDLEKGALHYSFSRYRRPSDGKPYKVPCMSTCGMLMSRKIMVDELQMWPQELGIYGGGENFINYTIYSVEDAKLVDAIKFISNRYYQIAKAVPGYDFYTRVLLDTADWMSMLK